MSEKTLDIDDLPAEGASEIWLTAGDPASSVIVLRRNDEVRAYRNICPHAGRFLNWAPGRFLFDRGRLVCAAHGAVFDTDTGLCVDGPCRGESLAPVAVEPVCPGKVRLRG